LLYCFIALLLYCFVVEVENKRRFENNTSYPRSADRQILKIRETFVKHFDTEGDASNHCLIFLNLIARCGLALQRAGALLSLCLNQLSPNPLRNLRNNGVSGTKSLCKVGRIQSEANPIILRRSLPLSHLIPSVRVSDESGTAHSDLGSGFVCQ
jgi:hypothetical protein